MINEEEIINKIRDAIDSLAGYETNFVTYLGSFDEDDMSSVRFVTNDPNGLVKGFIEKPYFDTGLQAYVVEELGAVFSVKGKGGIPATMITIEDRFVADGSDYTKVLEIVDELSGFEETDINSIGPNKTADISNVRFVTRDDSGLVKGFIEKPYYVADANAYVVDGGAVFSAVGSIRNDPAMIDKKTPTPSIGGNTLSSISYHEMTATRVMAEVLKSGEPIMMRKMPFDEMHEMYLIVKAAIPDDLPSLTIDHNEDGEIRIRNGDVIMAFCM